MRFTQILLSLALATVALAAIAAVPTGDSDAVAIEHRDISPRGQDDQISQSDLNEDQFEDFNVQAHNSQVLGRTRDRLAHWRGGLDEIYTDFVNLYHFQGRAEERKLVSQQDFDELHMIIRAASGKTLSLFQNTFKCLWTIVNAASDSYPPDRDETVQQCIREIIDHDWHPEQAVEDLDAHVKRQITTTAPPAGTTTVYTTVPAATAIEPALPDRPDELLATHVGGTYGVFTTNVVETTVVFTTPGVPVASVTTLTNPINPTVTTVRTLGIPTTTVNNTSIDTHSYIDISTFSATEMPTHASTPSLSLDSSIMSQMSSEMSGAMSSVIAASTLTTGGHTTSTRTGSLPSDTSTVGSNSVKNIDDSGLNTFLGIGACFALAWFL